MTPMAGSAIALTSDALDMYLRRRQKDRPAGTYADMSITRSSITTRADALGGVGIAKLEHTENGCAHVRVDCRVALLRRRQRVGFPVGHLQGEKDGVAKGEHLTHTSQTPHRHLTDTYTPRTVTRLDFQFEHLR